VDILTFTCIKIPKLATVC